MARARFNNETLLLFKEIKNQIALIDGKLMNPKLTNASDLKDLKAKLQNRYKNLLEKYYEESTKTLVSKTEALIARLEAYDVKKMSKE